MNKINDFIKDRTSIVVWSLPRSGTHLAMQFLKDNGFTEWFPETIKNGIYNIINMPKKDHFCFGGHIYPRDMAIRFKASGLKGLYTTRDLRDVAISLAWYIKKKETTNPSHELFKNLPIEDCINLVINGYNKLPQLKIKRQIQDEWLNFDNILEAPYEELAKTESFNNRNYKFCFRNGSGGEYTKYPNCAWEKLK